MISLQVTLQHQCCTSLYCPICLYRYARVHGRPNENDKGYLSISYGKHVTALQKWLFKNHAHFYRLTILCSFICLNIATPIALTKSAFLNYPRIMANSSTGNVIECLYWATAIVALPFNIFYTVSSIRGINCSLTSLQLHHVLCTL